MDGATDVLIVVGPVSTVNSGFVEDKGAVVLTHGKGVIVSYEFLAGESIQVVSGVLSVVVA